MDISLLSGVTLKGISIANPAPFSGDLLTADEFVLRYRLRPLLSRRLEVDRVSLERPALGLVMDGRGVFNYERLGARSDQVPPSAASTYGTLMRKIAATKAIMPSPGGAALPARQRRRRR